MQAMVRRGMNLRSRIVQRANAKSFGLILGGAALAISMPMSVAHDGAGTGNKVNKVTVAKNAINATENYLFPTPSPIVRSGGSDSGMTTKPTTGS
ncbi:hypothetical protein ABIA30_002045 [Mycobacterium sp. MAA66]|uniref:hypothetical protein n=1 Tax=Mycobacterium sp. MAA66 TaxID=3156297 RepID=UPI0035112EFC